MTIEFQLSEIVRVLNVIAGAVCTEVSPAKPKDADTDQPPYVEPEVESATAYADAYPIGKASHGIQVVRKHVAPKASTAHLPTAEGPADQDELPAGVGTKDEEGYRII